MCMDRKKLQGERQRSTRTQTVRRSLRLFIFVRILPPTLQQAGAEQWQHLQHTTVRPLQVCQTNDWGFPYAAEAISIKSLNICIIS